MKKETTKKEKYELAQALKRAHEAKKEYERLRKEVDELTGKTTTVFDYYGKALEIEYEPTTTTVTDYKALFEEFGITEDDKARYTTKTATMRFKAVH